jgi:putative tricarboxylic transport membrane protein
MELIDNLSLGFATAMSLQNLAYAFLGCLLGTLVGVLPGIGPLATISMLLPFTFGLDPTTALIMLAGIYYGAAYGGSTTAILVNLPGETSSVVTVIDGHQMARQGRAGQALATAAIASFVAGCIGTLVLAASAIPLSNVALRFGAPDYFSLMVLGLIASIGLSAGSILKSIGMILIGIAVGLIGIDLISGAERYTLGFTGLLEGMPFIVLAVGLFAFGEVIVSICSKAGDADEVKFVGRLLPDRNDFRRMAPSITRGTIVGTLLGILPGAGQSLSSFIAYAVERRLSSHRAEMGHGAIEGVAAPEAANNAAAQTSFIPTLTLGVPGSATMALILGAMVMHNIQPGPQVMTSNPSLFWGLIVSMWIGNVILVVLNLPLVRLWVKLTHIPYDVLFPAILVFSCFGVLSGRMLPFDLYLAAVIGLLGYVFRKLGCELAPLLLGFVLGPMLEENFRRALVLSEGDATVFLREPISAAFLAIAAMILVLASLPLLRRKRVVLSETD